MEQLGISEATVRLLISYLAQGALGVMMFLIFQHFSRVYIRRFLRSWSRGWLAFSVYAFSTIAIIILNSVESSSLLNITLSLLVQLGSYFHIVFILLGSYQLVFSKPVSRKVTHLVVYLTVGLALLTVLPYSWNPDEQSARYVLRLGSRSIISGCGFLFASAVVWTNPKFTRGYGQKILAFSFLVFSLYQFSYLSVIFSNVQGVSVSLPGSTGLINLLMISVMCMGMVMWLLEDERSKLNKANKDLDSFLYSTSHDLRAPIASILGLTFVGKMELKEEKAQEFMGLIEQRVKKMNAILSDILSLARAKKLEVKLEQLSFDTVVDETLSEIQFDSKTSQIALVYDRDPDNQLFSDRNQLKIILGNLIGNAIKYHRLRQDRPFIRIGFQRSADKVAIEVEDNGQGIPESSLPRIFEMFFRATEQGEGTGLGLFIVKESLEKIKGTITVSSTFGKGTLFTIYLDGV